MKKHNYHGKSEDPNVQISKAMTYYLRHGAEKEGLAMRPDGYVIVDDLFKLPNMKNKNMTYDKLKSIVDTNDKKRFELAEFPDTNGKPILHVRATQGHSIKVVNDDLLLTKIEDASSFPVVIHGSYLKNWEPIKKEGLKTMGRNHIHLAPGYPGENEVISGMRFNCSLIIEIDMEKALKDGMVFYLSKNNVILTSGFDNVIPPKYFKKVQDRKKKVFLDLNDVAGDIEEEKKVEVKGKDEKLVKNQDLDYILIVDFEAQCEEGKHLEIQEIIEFPVVPINLQTGNIESDLIFHHYLKPVVIPKLTEFCTNLTGITQDQVDKGMLLDEALEHLHEHLSKTDILNKKWCFVTCGDWDINNCLRNEAKKKKIPLRDYMKRWINIKKVFQHVAEKSHKGSSMGMTNMLEHFELSLDGRHHSGIDDCKNISKIALKLIEKGVKFTEKLINDYKN